MPRAEVGTPKYLANAMKSKGLQRLRWYCQVCEKQCRDDNGFKCHIATESHLRQMLVVGESAGKHISDFSMQFQAEFVSLLSRRFGTNRVKANNVYQEYIADKHHLHMNSTRWVSLSEFVKHLGRSGVVRVDETEKGFFISWIDNSPKALAKAEANQKKERAVTSDEQRERLLIAEQIERAKATSGEASGSRSRSASPEPSAPVGLQRDENAGPLRLSFGIKKSTSPPAPTEDASSTSPPASTSDYPANTSASVTPSDSSIPTASVPTPQPALKFNAFKKNSSSAAAVPAKTAPLKMNVFKAAKTSSTGSSTSGSSVVGDKRPRDDMPAAQRLILEDQERKRRRVGAV